MSRHLLHRTRYAALCIVVLFILFAGATWLWLWQRNQHQVAAEPPQETVRTGLVGEYATSVRIAKAKGYFAEQNLTVTISEYSSGPATLADLLAGKIDLGLASDFAGVRNSFNGQDLKIIANMSKSEAFFLVARKDRGITQPSNLKGKKIGITRKTVGEFYLGQFLSFNKLTVADVAIVDLTQADLVTGIQKGTIDAVVLFEPNAYHARQALGSNGVEWSVQANQSINSLLYTTGAFIQAHPDVTTRYLKAVLKGEEFLKEHPQEAKAILALTTGYDQAYLDYIWPRFDFSMSLDEELLINMDDEARWVMENKLTSATTVPNYFHMLYLTPLEAVKPAAVTVIR